MIGSPINKKSEGAGRYIRTNPAIKPEINVIPPNKELKEPNVEPIKSGSVFFIIMAYTKPFMIPDKRPMKKVTGISAKYRCSVENKYIVKKRNPEVIEIVPIILPLTLVV
jgi:hypothetical protein